MTSEGSTTLGAVLSAFDDVVRESLDGLSSYELGDRLIALDVLANQVKAEQARCAVRFDSLAGASAVGLPSTAAWLRANTTAPAGEAAQLVRVGRALRDRLPNTAAALAAGDISWAAAGTIERGLRPVVGADAVAEAEALLAAHAPRLTLPQLTHATRRTLQLIHPEAAQRDSRQRYEDRCLHLAPLLDGSMAINGQLDEEGAAVLLSALTPLALPLGADDDRTAPQRRADALVELVAKAAADGHAGTQNNAGLPPTLLVRVDVERLTGGNPSNANAKSPHATGDLEWAGPILRTTLERIGCTAQVIRMVTAGKSRVLDVGTAQRLAGPAQRLALAARDRGCVFPGCDRPPPWTDAHHVIPWSEGGGTDLDNLVLLCRHHHRLVHEGGWSLHGEPRRLNFHNPQGRSLPTRSSNSPLMITRDRPVRPGLAHRLIPASRAKT